MTEWNPGSIEKIDDNNFVIKYQTSNINKTYWLEHLDYMDYSWNFRTDLNSKGHVLYYLDCIGSNSYFWNIDASLTWNFIDENGRKEISKSVEARFNLSNPGSEIDTGVKTTCEVFEHLYPDIEVCVRINSITGIPQRTMAEFDEENILSDVVLIVEEKKLFVSKVVLATYSPVFRAMLFSGFKEATDKEVIIKDVKYDDFKKFLQVIHSSHPHINNDNVEKMLILADRYDVALVTEKCEKYLQTTNDVPLAKKLRLAESYILTDAYKQLMGSIDTKEKVDSICKTRSFLGPITLDAIIKKMMDFQIDN